MFPKHSDGKRFYNPGACQARGYADLLRWQLSSRRERSPHFVADVRQTQPPRRVDGSALKITLINHSTVLMQHQGCNILTDPIWSERASPLSWVGPRRRRAPGVSWEDLPPIDVVLLSHNHYDHFDLPTLRRLKSASFVVPLGVGKLLRSENIAEARELDWGESGSFPGFTVHSVPAYHFSGRGLSDRNETLWGGYVIESQNRMIYFAGDTAFGDHFTAIRERFGAPHVALLPIGAYEPRWFMSPVHMAPDEAIRAHAILDAGTSIAVHHGTFQLADEGLDSPKKELAACGAPESFRVLANGQSFDLP